MSGWLDTKQMDERGNRNSFFFEGHQCHYFLLPESSRWQSVSWSRSMALTTERFFELLIAFIRQLVMKSLTIWPRLCDWTWQGDFRLRFDANDTSLMSLQKNLTEIQ
jgi:hypothetical protein